MAEQLPIKYAKQNGERFLPVTSPKAVIDENGKSIDSLLQKHRIGDFIFSDNPQSPAEEFGGTWLLVEEVFLYGASANYPVGSRGGEATHTLTIDEMPKHSHGINVNGWGEQQSNQKDTVTYNSWTYNWREQWNTTVNAGNSQPHNNMPPYRATYIWQRIA